MMKSEYFSFFYFFFYFQDNDHGQQENGSITVNRRPTLVQGIDGIKITQVACGSSHSVAWTAPEPLPAAPPSRTRYLLDIF